MAKDILHMTLPDSKAFSVFLIHVFACNRIRHPCHIYCSLTAWLCCSSLAERGGACCSWMCLGSLPQCDWKRCRALSLASTAAGGVGAVLRTADCSAGKWSVAFLNFWLRLRSHLHVFIWTSFLRLISKAWNNSRVTHPSWACHTFAFFSHLILRYCLLRFSVADEGTWFLAAYYTLLIHWIRKKTLKCCKIFCLAFVKRTLWQI